MRALWRAEEPVAMAQGQCAGGSVGWVRFPLQICGSVLVRNLVLSWTGFKNVGNLHQELFWTLGWQQGHSCACGVFLPTRQGSGVCWSVPVGNPFPCPQISPNISPCAQGQSDIGWFRVQNKISWEATTKGQRKGRGDVLGPCHPRGTPS